MLGLSRKSSIDSLSHGSSIRGVCALWPLHRIQIPTSRLRNRDWRRCKSYRRYPKAWINPILKRKARTRRRTMVSLNKADALRALRQKRWPRRSLIGKKLNWFSFLVKRTRSSKTEQGIRSWGSISKDISNSIKVLWSLRFASTALNAMRKRIHYQMSLQIYRIFSIRSSRLDPQLQ